MTYRRADIKTGFNCNCNCVFCVVGDVLFTGERPTEAVMGDLREARPNNTGVVFTGGEPSIRPDFLKLVAYAKSLGYEVIQVQTNGRIFAYPEFCRRAAAAGINEYAPAIHGSSADVHDRLVRAEGSFDQVVASVQNFRALGVRIITNSVVCRQNLDDLGHLVALLVSLRPDQIQLAYAHPQGHAQTSFNAVVPVFAEAAPRIRAALRIAKEAGIFALAEAVPYCYLPGAEEFAAENYIPTTALWNGGMQVADYRQNRLDSGKRKFPQCVSCRFDPVCEGPWREYPDARGGTEFVPIPGVPVYDGAIITARLLPALGSLLPRLTLEDQSGAPVSLSSRADGKLAIYFYPEDFSPGCTAQACSIRDSGLPAHGISVLGISPDPAARHREFAAAHALPFPLLADPRRQAFEALGGPRWPSPRTTLLYKDGVLRHIITQPDTAHHGGEIRAWFARLDAAPPPQEPTRARPARLTVLP